MSETGFSDPREELTYEPEPGMVFRDERHSDDGALLTLVYLDDYVALLRSSFVKERGAGRHAHRLSPREMFEIQLGAGRLKRVDEESPVPGGHLSDIKQRAEELEQSDGRKGKHYAEALHEAVELFTDGLDEEDRETVPFEDIDGVGGNTASNLRAAGYTTAGDVRRASDDSLLDIRGVGEGNLQNIRNYVG